MSSKTKITATKEEATPTLVPKLRFPEFRKAEGWKPITLEELKRHITSGARSNGLLNISKETFFGVEIPTPNPAKQQKIAECLSSVDDLMAAQARKVDALTTVRRTNRSTQ